LEFEIYDNVSMILTPSKFSRLSLEPFDTSESIYVAKYYTLQSESDKSCHSERTWGILSGFRTSKG